MQILILSDIHANITAFEAVLADAGKFDAVWCLGDLVGYGPDPNECIFRIQELPGLVCLLGNHDAAALGQIDVDTFNIEARQALMWTQQVLNENSKSFLQHLPERQVIDLVTLVHGSPRQPVWEYLLDTRTATLNFNYFDTPYCFVGHTHLPVLYHLPDTSRVAKLIVPESTMEFTMAPRAILNPGSVGQPRDRDAQASYALYDTSQNKWQYKRIAYDIPAVQERMASAGLPERHIQRLSAGW